MLHREVALLQRETPPGQLTRQLLSCHYPFEWLMVGNEGEGVPKKVGAEAVG